MLISTRKGKKSLLLEILRSTNTDTNPYVCSRTSSRNLQNLSDEFEAVRFQDLCTKLNPPAFWRGSQSEEAEETKQVSAQQSRK